MIKLSLATARLLAVRAQGLDVKWRLPAGKEGAAQVIERLGYVQIDTISVVERAHHHTLWNRRSDYRPVMLEELLARDRRVFEYWAAPAAAYVPMADYRWYLPRMRRERDSKRANQWLADHAKTVKLVRDRIEREGPLGSSDFEASSGTKRAGWWDWKPAKRALELLFNRGELMVSGRRGFQRQYDLSERVLPRGIDTTVPEEDAVQRFGVRRYLAAHCVAPENNIRWGSFRRSSGNALQDLLGAGEAVRVHVEPFDGEPWYALKHVIESIPSRRTATRRIVRILSPFDSLLGNRQRVSRLFDFHYRIECYTPRPQRTHGYFCLPILFGSDLVGRIDAKAERKDARLRVHRVTLESKIDGLEEFISAFAHALRGFAAFNYCDEIVIDETRPRQLLAPMKRALA